MLNKNSKIYIAGHTGMVGSALVRKFTSEGLTSIVTRTLKELDLRRQTDVEKFFEQERPEVVIIAAAKVGGILANNTYRAEFIYDNLMIETNLIHSSYLYGVKKLIFLGSSCIYPRDCPQPMKEEYLLTSPLEPTNEPYAVAKIAGIKMCENYYRQYGCNFFSVMPTNLYGPNDNFDLENSHVLPALIRKFHEAKVNNAKFVEVWGSGKPKREFMYVDDLADAVFFTMRNVDSEKVFNFGITHINIGTGADISINELAILVKEITNYQGTIKYNSSKPDGMPEKKLDVSRLNKIGWKYNTELYNGIAKTYNWYKKRK